MGKEWCSPDGAIILINSDSYRIAGINADLVLTDPPYGVTDCAWDKTPDFTAFWKMLHCDSKPSAPLVITATQPFTSLLVCSNLKEFRVEWIWRKNAGSNVGTVRWYPMKEHESVLVFSRESPTLYNPIRQLRSKPLKPGIRKPSGASKGGAYAGLQKSDKGFEVKDGEMRCPSSVQDFNRERGLHPNQKPVALCEYLIRTYSNPGALVFDPFAGSASIGIACMNTGRKYVGYELDAAYYSTAVERLSQHYAETHKVLNETD